MTIANTSEGSLFDKLEKREGPEARERVWHFCSSTCSNADFYAEIGEPFLWQLSPDASLFVFVAPEHLNRKIPLRIGLDVL